MAQGAGELPGPQQLGGAGVDESGVEGFGQPLRGLGGDPSATGGSLARRVDEVADEVVALPGQGDGARFVGTFRVSLRARIGRAQRSSAAPSPGPLLR
jgi:hypothetical protein